MIYVGDTVLVDFIDVGMSHRERVIGPAVVTAVMPYPRVKPRGWAFDRSVSWSEICAIEDVPVLGEEREAPALEETGR